MNQTANNCAKCAHLRKAPRLVPRDLRDFFMWCERADDACLTERLGGGSCGREGRWWTPRSLNIFMRMLGVRQAPIVIKP